MRLGRFLRGMIESENRGNISSHWVVVIFPLTADQIAQMVLHISR